jgi:hypothetical protein
MRKSRTPDESDRVLHLTYVDYRRILEEWTYGACVGTMFQEMPGVVNRLQHQPEHLTAGTMSATDSFDIQRCASVCHYHRAE